MSKKNLKNKRTNPRVVSMLIALVAVMAVTFSSCKKDVESVALNKNTLTLTVGASETLTATVTPSNAEYDALTWTSSNASVAKVDNSGKVTGVANGTATITVAVAGKTAICAVTVGQNTVSTYQVGDLYNVGGIKGIVFEVTDGGKHGKIIAIDNIETYDYKWSTKYEVTGATDTLDGSKNMAVIKTMSNWETNYPAFKYFDDKGFYIPAKNELVTIMNNYDAIMDAIVNNGGQRCTADRYNLSSTEISSKQIIALEVTGTTIYVLSYYKDSHNHANWVLGICKF
jgi:hypothetical protein